MEDPEYSDNGEVHDDLGDSHATLAAIENVNKRVDEDQERRMKGQQTLDPGQAFEQMANIDMDNDTQIQELITTAISPALQERLTFTLEDEKHILSLYSSDTEFCKF